MDVTTDSTDAATPDGSAATATPSQGTTPATTYSFSVDSLRIDNTRSLHKDTDFVSVTLAVGSDAPQTKTKSMGDLNNGTFDVGLRFDGVAVGDGQTAILTYAVVNNGHSSDSDVQSALQKAGTTLAQKAASAAASAAGSAIGAALGASIGTAAVPLIGTALGALGGWLVGELGGIIFADCDGPVAAGVHAFASADLTAGTAGGASLSGCDHSDGIDSPTGCGSNSSYYVSWSVAAAQS